MLVGDLIAFRDPMTDWGHLLSLAVGVSTWPLIRRRHRAGADGSGGRGTADPAVRAAQAPGTLAA
ncbi:hypothetical protein ACWD7F_14640 [Streptomyces sp. NPDC005122]